MRRCLRKYDRLRPLKYVLSERFLLGVGLYTMFLVGNVGYNNYKAEQALQRFDNIILGNIEGDTGQAMDDHLKFESRAGNFNPFD
ncbi:MAG: hypothetical protein JW754_00915 [Candidatus Aenigmarchaeota archaeon]|nr:hypothetical protein [Candidatus Aenigmarchaeota archaeon]